MAKVQGKMLVHVSEAVLKRHTGRRDAIFGPEGYHVEWRLLRAPVEMANEPISPVSLTFSVQAAGTTPTSSPAAP
jgi:hypothetical protein